MPQALVNPTGRQFVPLSALCVDHHKYTPKDQKDLAAALGVQVVSVAGCLFVDSTEWQRAIDAAIQKKLNGKG